MAKSWTTSQRLQHRANELYQQRVDRQFRESQAAFLPRQSSPIVQAQDNFYRWSPALGEVVQASFRPGQLPAKTSEVTFRTQKQAEKFGKLLSKHAN